MKIRFNCFTKISASSCRLAYICSGLMAVTLLAGCFANFGRIHYNDDVTRAFETDQIDERYNFYQYTTGMRVFAIIGLDPKLELQSRIWRALDVDTEDFKVATSRMWYNDFRNPRSPRGAYIMDPDGEIVGVYFSSVQFASIKFKPENQVMVMLDTTHFLGGPGGPREH